MADGKLGMFLANSQEHAHNMTANALTDHLPECPAPLCDWGDPSAKCMGYEDCHHLCCCAALRACEQRVLDAAREAVAALPKEDGGYCHVLHACDVEAVIEALREKP